MALTKPPLETYLALAGLALPKGVVSKPSTSTTSIDHSTASPHTNRPRDNGSRPAKDTASATHESMFDSSPVVTPRKSVPPSASHGLYASKQKQLQPVKTRLSEHESEDKRHLVERRNSRIADLRKIFDQQTANVVASPALAVSSAIKKAPDAHSLTAAFTPRCSDVSLLAGRSLASSHFFATPAASSPTRSNASPKKHTESPLKPASVRTDKASARTLASESPVKNKIGLFETLGHQEPTIAAAAARESNLATVQVTSTAALPQSKKTRGNSKIRAVIQQRPRFGSWRRFSRSHNSDEKSEEERDRRGHAALDVAKTTTQEPPAWCFAGSDGANGQRAMASNESRKLYKKLHDKVVFPAAAPGVTLEAAAIDGSGTRRGWFWGHVHDSTMQPGSAPGSIDEKNYGNDQSRYRKRSWSWGRRKFSRSNEAPAPKKDMERDVGRGPGNDSNNIAFREVACGSDGISGNELQDGMLGVAAGENLAVAEARCNLQHPRPVRADEVNRLVSLCTKREGAIGPSMLVHL
ncbi:hypothetical protein SPI_01229 [Niveomyces insectorum RCEF 264]|uniref:Uncharacterized protein n=1 Tax=Niveomyces insectorum RCEF 264 TaxID=1081102 RepID=A0A167YT13_9HYPO|nr:hypothetical protein SPI_01229 [Niveomyces insectorum RCEF 264]